MHLITSRAAPPRLACRNALRAHWKDAAQDFWSRHLPNAGTATAHVIRTLHGVPAPFRPSGDAVRLSLPGQTALQDPGQSPSLRCVTEEPEPLARPDEANSEADEAAEQDLVRASCMLSALDPGPCLCHRLSDVSGS